jgi:acyl-CoA synthetase (AMP-forming)/AMP-acid ligase II
VLERAGRLGAALTALGVRPGDRVATLRWNQDRHLEAYYAIPAIGAVLHTLNLRLHPEELAYIATDAADRIVIVDEDLLPGLEGFRARAPFERVIVIREGTDPPAPGLLDDEALLAGSTGLDLTAAELAEQNAAAMCCTSGTTGRPKGVVYSHRALALHSLMLCLTDAGGLTESDVVLPVVPMFHANAWGIPFGAAMVGASQVLPGRAPDAGGHPVAAHR